MKVLWVSHLVPWPPKGGVLQRSFHLLREAASRHAVDLVALNQVALLPTPSDVEEASRELARFCRDVRVFPIPSDRSRARRIGMAALSFLRSTPYDTNWLRSAALKEELGRRARSGGYDVVHLDTLGLAPHLSAFPGTAVVLNHHNIESDMMGARIEHEPAAAKRLYFRREARKLEAYERLAAPRCAMNLVVSELDRERLRVIAGDVAAAVVENGVDLDYFRPGSGG